MHGGNSSRRSLTVKVCQFFNVISQVSSHGQGLSHLEVCLPDKGRREEESDEEEEEEEEAEECREDSRVVGSCRGQ